MAKLRVKYPFFLLLLILLLLFGLFLAVSYFMEYRPGDKEVVFENKSDARSVRNFATLDDTVTIVTWNIGYAGLGDNMDFFYDGGKRIRDTRERTVRNLNDIIDTLRKIDADIMLLQEADVNSHRTYGINEIDSLAKAFPDYALTFAYNYNAWFVPLPLKNPMGRVKSGMAILSRAVPLEVVRYNYPSGFTFPNRMFNLKRGLLSAKFLTSAGDTILVNNTHNTAYDAGGMRREEMLFLRDFLFAAYSSGILSVTGGDWNQFPPAYIPAEKEISNTFYVPGKIDGGMFGDMWQFVYPHGGPSLRYLDYPYSDGSITTITDFFLLSPGLRAESVEVFGNRFKSSDHNPVVMKLVIGDKNTFNAD